MIGETALSTRTKCDECRVQTATRETHAGVFCETCEPLIAANDDILGKVLSAHPLCSRCQIRPAMLRVDETRVLCSECWRQLDARLIGDIVSIPSAVPTPDAKVTAAGSPPSPYAPVAVTPNSVDPGPAGFDFDPEIERLVSALERGWVGNEAFPEPIFIGIDLVGVKYDATSASFAASAIVPNSSSESAT
jgi:hypothetical protein